MPTGSRLSLATPPGFDLSRTVCSYGYFLLAPNTWDPDAQALTRVFAGPRGRPFEVRVHQVRPGSLRPAAAGALALTCSKKLEHAEAQAVRAALGRMLRIDEDPSAWWKACPEARKRRFGRMFRSPTFFEDLVKTITGQNVSWPNTIRMNALLCEKVGRGAFPSPKRVVAFGADRLKAECKVGYRAPRIAEVARRVEDGKLDPAWFDAPDRTSTEVYEALLALPGIGPYGAANVCTLLGHYDRIPIDTETYRHMVQHYGWARPGDEAAPAKAELDRAIDAHYAPAAPYQFKQYWFELWRDYERRRGPAWRWRPKTVGPTFTASQLQPG